MFPPQFKKLDMKKVNIIGGIVLSVFVIVSCSTVSKEQKLVQEFESANGETVKIEDFINEGTYTYADSVAYWEDILEEKVAVFLTQMDSAEARLEKSNKAAKEGLENNKFPALDDMFKSTIRENELIQLRIDINRVEATTDGGDTPLREYYQKIDSLKTKGDEVIYNQYKGKIVIDGEQISKTYYLSADNSKVEKAVAQ